VNIRISLLVKQKDLFVNYISISGANPAKPIWTISISSGSHAGR
jgi:hypothetical protein